MTPTLPQLNDAADALRRGWRFSRDARGRLIFHTPHGQVAARLTAQGNNLAFEYGRLGLGGTEAAALAQLIRWSRDLTRVPRRSWEYWRRLGLGTGSPLPALERHGYFDPAKTACVLCGKQPDGVDWWALNGLTGPCCRFGECRGGALAPTFAEAEVSP